MAGTLILVRHGQTDGNADNVFTGWDDPGLTPTGRTEASAAGTLLAQHGHVLDQCYVSALRRSRQTLDGMLAAMAIASIPIAATAALNERNYGALTGLNKDDARARWGPEQVQLWRRNYDAVPPDGESLRQTAARVIPYYDTEIVPRLAAGQTVLIVAHGNSLRVLVMAIEGLMPDEAGQRELATGGPVIYRHIGANGRVDLCSGQATSA